MLKAIKNLIIYFLLLTLSLNVIWLLQVLFNNIGRLRNQEQILGMFYSGFVFISFLLMVLLSFYFFIRCTFCIFQIIKVCLIKLSKEL